MKISFDLDDVIFDTQFLFESAFKEYGKTFSYDIYTDYSLKNFDSNITNRLFDLFKDNLLYTMPLLDNRLPSILNSLMKQPDLKILFVTQRLLKQPFKSFKQLRNAGIQCSFKQVYDKNGKKSDILKQINPDYHFDDSPNVISGCLEKNIPIVMISNDKTRYNHYLRKDPRLKNYYPDLISALIDMGIYTK